MKTHFRPVFRVLVTACAAVATVPIVLLSSAVVPAVADAAQQAPVTSVDLTGIRVGRHATYDRIVLDFRGGPPASYRATWVPTLVADPSGQPVSLPGNDFLQVVVQGAAGTDVNGWRTYSGPRQFRTFATRNVRAVAITGDFERVLGIGIGTRQRAWVHVFTLRAPSRLVIDVGR